MVDTSECHVAGSVSCSNGALIGAVGVQAYERDLSDGEPLGGSTTNGLGRYELSCGTARLQQAGKDRVALVVRVSDTQAVPTPLAESDVLEVALADTRVGHVVGPKDAAGPSEYERYVDAVHSPPLTDLDEDAIAALAVNTGSDRGSIGTLVRSARPARETAVAPTACYGLARKRPAHRPGRAPGCARRDAARRYGRSVDRAIVPAAVARKATSIVRWLIGFRFSTGPRRDIRPASGIDTEVPLFAGLDERRNDPEISSEVVRLWAPTPGWGVHKRRSRAHAALFEACGLTTHARCRAEVITPTSHCDPTAELSRQEQPE